MAAAAEAVLSARRADDIKVFRVERGVFVKFDAATWHAGPLFEGAEDMDFYNLELADTNVVDHNTHVFSEQDNVVFQVELDGARQTGRRACSVQTNGNADRWGADARVRAELQPRACDGAEPTRCSCCRLSFGHDGVHCRLLDVPDARHRLLAQLELAVHGLEHILAAAQHLPRLSGAGAHAGCFHRARASGVLRRARRHTRARCAPPRRPCPGPPAASPRRRRLAPAVAPSRARPLRVSGRETMQHEASDGADLGLLLPLVHLREEGLLRAETVLGEGHRQRLPNGRLLLLRGAGAQRSGAEVA
eukprot:scaffold1789_cov375-Prasinococcus_capsulatus_cf.AAC.22